MLQYNTGKFWQSPNLKKLTVESTKTITLYSNFQPKHFSSTIIKTNAGDLSVHNDGVLMYKLKQKSLAFPGAAYNPFKDYANDFAALLTFFTGALFLSEKDVFERLISKRQSLNISTPSCQLISPYFEEEVIISEIHGESFLSLLQIS
ncbi:hypothetical protein FAI40_04005 [Acetobacteraceae bacterium]|nr:hypothetical protein FAI40_04005 [Acetobacteraceae bacterium]